MEDAPSVENRRASVQCVEAHTGIVLDLTGAWALPGAPRLRHFDSVDAALAYAQAHVERNPLDECVIRNAGEANVAVIRDGAALASTRKRVPVIRFSPSGSDWLKPIRRVTVWADRLALETEASLYEYPWATIAVWPRPALLSRARWRLGSRAPRAYVGERLWCASPRERFLRFFLTPPVTLYMPKGDDLHGDSCFRRSQDIIAKGGFLTHDLG